MEDESVVTTVREETTKDLDILAKLEEAKTEEAVEEQPKVEADDKDKKIGALHRDLRMARKEIERLKAAPPQAAAEPAVLEKPVFPKRGAFKTSEDYETAVTKHAEDLAEYTLARKQKQQAEEQAEKAQKAKDEKLITTYNAALPEFKAAHPDFDEVMDSDMELTPVMVGAAVEYGLGLSYWYGKNPEKAAEIAAMEDDEAIAAIARITARLDIEAEGVKPKPAASGKPKPEPPVPVAGRAAVPRDTSKMTFAEKEAEYAKRNPGALNYA